MSNGGSASLTMAPVLQTIAKRTPAWEQPGSSAPTLADRQTDRRTDRLLVLLVLVVVAEVVLPWSSLDGRPDPEQIHAV